MSKSVYRTTAGWNIEGRWIASVSIKNGNDDLFPTGFRWYNSTTKTYTNAEGTTLKGTGATNRDRMYIYLSPAAGPPNERIFFTKNELKIVNRRLTRVDNGDYLVYDLQTDFPGNYTGERYIDVLEAKKKVHNHKNQKKKL